MQTGTSQVGAAAGLGRRTGRSSELAGLAPLGISFRFGAATFIAASY